MGDKTLVRIEYSEMEGDFHFESEQNDSGYRTISDKVNSKLAFEFCEKIDEKYPELYDRNQNHPSFDQVEKEFQEFVVNRKQIFS